MLITANRDYYPLDRVPEFWEWLVHHGTSGQVKIPIEMVEEIREGTISARCASMNRPMLPWSDV